MNQVTKKMERLEAAGYQFKDSYFTNKAAKADASRWRSRDGGGLAQIVSTSSVLGTRYHLYVKRRDDPR